MKFIKSYLLLLFISSSVYAQFGELVHPYNFSATSVYFINSKTGFVLGDSGVLLKVTQGGTNIQKLNTGTIKRLNKCFFTNPKNGFIAGDKGILLTSTDSGNTWSNRIIFNNVNLNDIFFTDTQNGFICGDNGLFLKTVNGGFDWEFINTGIVYYLTSIFFLSSDTGFVAGSKGTFYKTTQGGNSWTNINLNTSELLTSIFFTKSKGYVTGMSGVLLKTTDRGLSWRSDTLLINGTLYDLECTDNYCFLSSQNGNIFYKENDGLWKNVSLNITEDILSLAVPDVYVCYSVNTKGKLFKTCPKATILFLPSSTQANTFNFKNNSKNISSLKWDFGDGTTSTDDSPVHNFSGKGIYQIKLIVENETGCKDSASVTVSVTDINESLFGNKYSVVILPNPSNDFIKIQINGVDQQEIPGLKVEIIDLTGIKIILQGYDYSFHKQPK